MRLVHLVRFTENPGEWKHITNPVFKEPHAEGYAKLMLQNNTFTQYVEWSDGGSVYRVIRARDLKKYM